MSITDKEYRSAYDEGRRYRRASRPREACSKHDHTNRGQLLNEAREQGWDDENGERLALAAAGVRLPA